MIKVLVADDHPIFRAGLRHILMETADIAVASEVDNGLDLINKIRAEMFDVLVLDMSMPGRSGVELIKQIKSERPKMAILVLSTHKEDIFAVRTIKAGAAGYLCKDNTASDLVPALRKVACGGVFISPVLAEQLVMDINSAVSDMNPHTLLSNREYQIFLMIVAGKGITEIAEELSLSVKTVSTHKIRIKEKTKLANTSEFVHYAIKHGLVAEG